MLKDAMLKEIQWVCCGPPILGRRRDPFLRDLKFGISLFVLSLSLLTYVALDTRLPATTHPLTIS